MDWKQRSLQINGRDTAWYWLAFFTVLVAGSLALLWLADRYAPNRPVSYDDPLQNFKYGSIGTDMDNGLPLEIVRLLPRIFPEYLPDDDSPRDYRAFGLIQEDGQSMPIGFSVRRRIIDLTGPNCAICHTGKINTPSHPQGLVIHGMPSNTADLQAFFSFLFKCAEDWRFNPDYLTSAIAQERSLSAVEKTVYKLIIPVLQGQLLARKAKLQTYFTDTSDHPRWGPGRVDTFNTFKFDQFAALYHSKTISPGELYGTVDMPPIWNQDKREGLWLHWDGNNDSVNERNFSAALAAGASRENLDDMEQQLYQLVDWIKTSLKPPPYPFPINNTLVERGKTIYRQYCFDCHDFNGSQVGTVVPLEQINTDRGRLDSYTDEFREIQRAYTAGHNWAFTRFRKTAGYANMPLDGLWARAPYLHNGAVPTLRDLLKPAGQRPASFYIGDTDYDPDKVGFRHDRSIASDGRALMRLDTALRGNGNYGHDGERYGTELDDGDKLALLEYLKTL